MTAAVIRTLRRIAQQAAPEYAARTGRYPNFDILRLLLALEVVFVHAWDAVDPNFNWAGLVMAVPAFLGISGFLVLQSYCETTSWINFLKKRALRVLPALFLSLALCFVLFDKNAMINSFLLWLSGGLYHLQGFRNTPLWSLAWEELAYLCLALLWVLGAYRRPFYLGLLLILAMGMVWAASSLAPASRLIFMLAPAFLIGNLMYLLRGKLLSVHPLIPWLVFYVMIEWRYVPSGQLLGGGVLLALQVFAVV